MVSGFFSYHVRAGRSLVADPLKAVALHEQGYDRGNAPHGRYACSRIAQEPMALHVDAEQSPA